MTSKFDDINDALDIEATEVSSDIVQSQRKAKAERDKPEEDKDYEYSRAQLYSLIEKGQDAVNGILDVADQSQSARSYEVAGQLIKHVADTTDKLIDLQQKMKDLKKEDPKGPSSVTNNALFIGSTSDLQKFLKQSGNEKKK
tara:strand:- start:695 stop:1120 length:426 start_codon:yes stop_codon:yes gene_type:complete